MKGGYQIISFATFGGGEGEKIVGAYKKAITGKAILIEDLDIGEGVRISGFGVAIVGDGSVTINITVGLIGITITITNEDVVTVEPIAYAEAEE